MSSNNSTPGADGIWIRHIRFNELESFCGKTIAGVWTFSSIEHAEREMSRKGRLIPCPRCLRGAKRTPISEKLIAFARTGDILLSNHEKKPADDER